MSMSRDLLAYVKKKILVFIGNPKHLIQGLDTIETLG
jgi:hypothetical protein